MRKGDGNREGRASWGKSGGGLDPTSARGISNSLFPGTAPRSASWASPTRKGPRLHLAWISSGARSPRSPSVLSLGVASPPFGPLRIPSGRGLTAPASIFPCLEMRILVAKEIAAVPLRCPLPIFVLRPAFG